MEERFCPYCGIEMKIEDEFSYKQVSWDYDTPPEYEKCLIKRTHECPECCHQEIEEFEDIFDGN